MITVRCCIDSLKHVLVVAAIGSVNINLEIQLLSIHISRINAVVYVHCI